MNEYEIDFDDDGNEVRVKVTKALLKQRLESANEQLAIARQQRQEAWVKATAAENRAAAMEFGNRLGAAIGELPVPFAVQAALSIDHGTVDVSHGFDAYPRRIPTMIQARLDVEFRGESEALKRLGEALVQR
jgi:hypothetical protein